MSDTPPAPYTPRRESTSRFETLRGLRLHLRLWGDASLASAARPPLVMLHGWMDAGASFQFVVDALAAADGFDRFVVAPDWRGFGLSDATSSDSYWFPDYLADLDTLLDRLWPEGPLDLLGHSMGGNIAMSYAALRPQRVRRLVNLEGFGLPDTKPEQAPKRMVQWLDELKTPARLASYAGPAEVAARLRANNALLPEDKALWLAGHWSAPGADGRWHLRADPAHKRANPVLYRRAEAVETWKLIQAPTLWAEGDRTDIAKWWGHRYPREDFEQRLAVVPRLERLLLSPAGHMVHHDQPEALAAALARFLA